MDREQIRAIAKEWNVPEEQVARDILAQAAAGAEAMNSEPKSAVHSANRAITGNIPVLGPILEHVLPQTWGELAADTASFALPVLGAAAATNPATAPLAPLLLGAGIGGRSVGMGRKVAGAGLRAGATGAVAGAAEGIMGGEDPLGTAVRVGVGTGVMEPVVGFATKLGLSVFGRRGIEANDLQTLSQVVEREVVNPYNGQPLFRFGTPDEVGMIAGGGGRLRLREMFEMVENDIRQQVGGQTNIQMPAVLFPGRQPAVAGGSHVSVTLDEALDRIKSYGAQGQFTDIPDATGYAGRRLYREAQDQITLSLTNIDPRAGAQYRTVREAYDKGLEFVELTEAPNVIRANTGKLDWNALQAATAKRLGDLERTGLSATPMTGLTRGAGDIPEAVFRGGGVTERDTSHAIPGLAWLFRGGQTVAGRPSIHVAPQFLQTIDYAGTAKPGLVGGPFASGATRSTAATAAERLTPRDRERERRR